MLKFTLDVPYYYQTIDNVRILDWKCPKVCAAVHTKALLNIVAVVSWLKGLHNNKEMGYALKCTRMDHDHLNSSPLATANQHQLSKAKS